MKRHSTISFYSVGILFLFCALGACSDSGEGTGTIPREIVSRAPDPLPAPWRLIPEFSIGVDYGDENYMLRSPWLFTILDNGTHVVLDNSPLQLRIYDSEGVFRQAFGSPGGGPGDLVFSGTNRTILQPAGMDRFKLWSNWPLRVQTWTVEGSLEDIQTIPQDHPLMRGRRPYVLRLLGSDLFGTFDYYQRLETGETEKTTYLIASSLTGSRCDTLFTTKDLYEMPMGAGMAQAAMDHPPDDAYLVTRSGKIYYSRMTEDWIHEVDTAGRGILLRFRWEHEPDSIPESLVEEFTGKFGKDLGEGAAWLRENVYLLHLAEGPDGEIWVQRTGEPDQDGSYPTDVFGRDGTYRGRILLPFEPRLQFIEGRKLYAIGKTEGDAPALIKYRMEPAK